MLNNYFRLYEECYLIEGETFGSIYNLLSGCIHDINKDEQDLLILLERNYSIYEVINTNRFNEIFISNTLKKIVEMDLGTYFDKSSYMEKINILPKWIDYLFAKPAPIVRRAFINIENRCNEKCSYCSNKTIRRYACYGCYTNNASKSMNKNEIFEVLNKLKKLDCQELYFTGGDVFLDEEKTIDILKYAKNLGFNKMNLIYGGKKIKDDIVKDLIELGVSLTIQMYLNSKDEIYSLEMLNKLALYKDNLKKQVVFVLSEIKNALDQSDLEYIAKKVNPQSIIQDPLYKSGTEYEYFDKTNSIDRIFIDEFSIKKKFNSCLFGTIHINCDGDINPCPGLQEFILGNIKDFYSIFSDDGIYKYWNLKKELLEGCSKCSHRYACNDCRSMDYKLTKNLYGLKNCKKQINIDIMEV